MTIKIVGGNANSKGVSVGRIYFPKEWIGRLVSIVLLDKKEEKVFFKNKREYEESILKREMNLKKHILKINRLREEVKKNGK